jgi:hypothetical protein
MARRPNPKIDPEAPAAKIAANYPSNSAFARALGRTPSTTQRWLEKGTIDPDYHSEVLGALRRDFPRRKFAPDIFVDQRLKNVAPSQPIEQAAAA